ncbi:MAG: lipocalin family protein [Bacteroidales bacterium]|nr:lipocalin family protein [Bacteroidales bacterium]
MKERIKFLTMLLMLFTMSISFSACGNDDDDISSSSLVGTWWVNGDTTDKWVFSSNGSFQSVNTVIAGATQTRTGTYSVSGDILVINIKAVAGSNNAYTNTYLIYSLTSTQLVLIDMDEYETITLLK